jgi:hypothetical protein
MRLLLVLLTLTTAGLAAVLVEVAMRPEISTLEIDRDRETINTQLKEAQTEAAKYSGGVIKAFLDLRIEILRNTLAMLDQTRSSYVRLITLRFTVDGRPFSAASDVQLREIEEEIKQVERKVADAKREASKYTGGLLQSMALMKVATEEASASTLRLKFYSAKYGIPLQIPSLKTEGEPAPAKNPGTVVKDREAL